MLNRKNITLKVAGKVQGVFFRASAKEIAIELGLEGYVKNKEDGSVLIEAEGTKEQLDILIEWCRHGPPNALVNELIIKEGVLKYFIEFTIHH